MCAKRSRSLPTTQELVIILALHVFSPHLLGLDLSIKRMPYDGPYLESAPDRLGEVHGHLHRFAGDDKVLEESRGQILGEHALVSKAPQVELHRFGFQEPCAWAVAELEFVKVRLLRYRADRRQLVRRELDDRVGAGMVPRHRIQLLRPYGSTRLAPQHPFVFLMHHKLLLSLAIWQMLTYGPRWPRGHGPRDEPEDSIPVNMVGARRTGWNAYEGWRR